MAHNEDYVKKLKEKYNNISIIINSYKLYELKTEENKKKVNICWHDGHPFEWDPLHLPLTRRKIKDANGTVLYYQYPNQIGDFCSFPCKKAYLLDKTCFAGSRERINEYITEEYITYHKQIKCKKENLNLMPFNTFYNLEGVNKGKGVNRPNIMIEKRFFLKANGLPTFESLLPAPPRELLLTGQMSIEEFRDMANCCVYNVSVPPSLGSSMIIEQFKNIKDTIESQIDFYESKLIPKKRTIQNEESLENKQVTNEIKGRGKGKGKGKKMTKTNNNSNIIQTLQLYSTSVNSTNEV